MNLIDAIRERILKFLKINHLTYDPNSERLTFITDKDNVIMQHLQEYRIWYIGDSDELLNYYTNQATYGNAKEPIYNRNKSNYFWGISAQESGIKRVHSGIPNAIISTLTNIVGFPVIESDNKVYEQLLSTIIDKNDFRNMVLQQQLPLTLVEGWGAFKVNFDKRYSDVPIIQYYEAQNVEFVYKSNFLIGIIFKDYYKYKNNNYVLLETRRIADGNSYIEFELFRYGKDGEVFPCEVSEIPELKNLQNITIPGYNEILAVSSKFYFDPLNKNYGRSIFAGKIDLFDDLDQILSQDSQTVRVSTPVEYYPVDLLERNRDGTPKMPQVYNRQYIAKMSNMDGDGVNQDNIQTTQPQLYFERYNQDAKAKLDYILTGLLSSTTLGIDISRRENAQAQREKEKITIMTRNNIIDSQVKIIKKLMNICLVLQEYINTGSITIKNYSSDIVVKFDEFAMPTIEQKLMSFGNAYVSGIISPEKLVGSIWGDSLSNEEKENEVNYIKNKFAQNISGGQLGLNKPELEEYGEEFN